MRNDQLALALLADAVFKASILRYAKFVVGLHNYASLKTDCRSCRACRIEWMPGSKNACWRGEEGNWGR